MSASLLLETPKNLLLAALPAVDYQRLLPQLEEVPLQLGQILVAPNERPDYVYFPHGSAVSLVSTMADKATTEVGLVGREGMVGIEVVLGGTATPNQAVVQIAGRATRMRAEPLKDEFDRGEALQKLLLRYVQALLTQVSQTAACNRQHTIDERLARWLLLTRDSVQSEVLPLTQEFVAHMLGVRRSGVTVAAHTLQQAGIIRYRRGQITLLDGDALEAAACECYSVVREEFQWLLGDC